MNVDAPYGNFGDRTLVHVGINIAPGDSGVDHLGERIQTVPNISVIPNAG